jgi:hypothetical protein
MWIPPFETGTSESDFRKPALYLYEVQRWEDVRDLNWSSEMGYQALWGIPPPALVERTHWSLATLRVSNEMRGMQALKVTKAARD